MKHNILHNFPLDSHLSVRTCKWLSGGDARCQTLCRRHLSLLFTSPQFQKQSRVFFTLFPKITQVCVKVNCYTILCKTDEVFTQSNVGVLTFYTMLCKNVNLYTGLCNDSISCICDKFYTNLCNFTQSCVSLH